MPPRKRRFVQSLIAMNNKNSVTTSLALHGTRLALLLLASGWLVALALVSVAVGLGFRVNVSPSVPLGVYRLVDTSPGLGDYVAVCPPQTDMFRAARAHGRLATGPCPGDFMPIFKVLAAEAGDFARIESDGVVINAELWPDSMPLQVDGEGVPLPRLDAAPLFLEPSEVLVMSERCLLGFDSRYFGAIPRSALIARLVPVFTWRGADTF